MTEYGLERERKRKRDTLRRALVLVCMFGVLALRAGIVDALLGLIALLVVGFSVYPLIVWSGRRAEVRRRATGAAPSWPAQLPVVVAKMWECPAKVCRIVDPHVDCEAVGAGQGQTALASRAPDLDDLGRPRESLRWDPESPSERKAPHR
jgi:hypothetical protein